MNSTQISDNYWVAPQLELDQISEAAAQGYQVVVCNRPDGEGPDQPSSEAIASACKDAGLDFIYLPMNGPNFTADYVSSVQQLIADNKKVLAYCRSGNRSSILFNAAQS